MPGKIGKFWEKVNAVDYDSPSLFYKFHGQRKKGVNLLYMIYRNIEAIMFIIITMLSIYRPEEDKPKDLTYLVLIYLIYLSNWAVLLCTVQSIIGAYITVKMYLKMRKNPECQNEDDDLPLLYKLYYILHNKSVPIIFLTTVLFWGLVYNPPEFPLTVVGSLVHGGCAIIMILSVLFVAFSYRFADFFHAALFFIIYIIFTYIYHLAGGVDRRNRPFIYDDLNWSEPGKCLLNVAMTFAGLFVLHVLAWLLSRFRLCIRSPTPCEDTYACPANCDNDDSSCCEMF